MFQFEQMSGHPIPSVSAALTRAHATRRLGRRSRFPVRHFALPDPQKRKQVALLFTILAFSRFRHRTFSIFTKLIKH